MSFPVYTLRIEPQEIPYYGDDDGRRRPRFRSRLRRDPQARRSRRRGGEAVPVFRVVLRKDRTIRVPRVQVTSPSAAAEVAHALIGDSPYEKLLAILVNANADIVGAIIIATSSAVSSTAVQMRGVFSGAIAHNASAVILAHNHPSGNPTPSDDDRRVAEAAARAAEILGIPVLDNIIVTRDSNVWRSFQAS